MKNIPERIYIHLGPKPVPACPDFATLAAVTLSAERIAPADIAYTRRPAWIAVTDRLPATDDHVLARIPHSPLGPAEVEVAYYDGRRWYTADGEPVLPSWWMQIPPLP